MQVRFNRRAPDETMVLLETVDGRVIERRPQICGRSACPKITVCFHFVVRFARSKQPVDPIIKRFQASLYRRVVVKQATRVVMKERRGRPYSY